MAIAAYQLRRGGRHSKRLVQARDHVKTTDPECGPVALTAHRIAVKLLATTGNTCSRPPAETTTGPQSIRTVPMVVAASYPFLEVFWTMLIFFAFVVWLASLFPHRIHWRDQQFYVRDKRLIPVRHASDARRSGSVI